MDTITRGSRINIPQRAALTVAPIAFFLLCNALPLASSYPPFPGNASAPAPLPEPTTLNTCRLAEPVVRRHSTTIEVWSNRAEPTAALRAAIWVATAVIAASSVAIAAAIDQGQRYRRPRTGSKRWEAGWAGQTHGGRPAELAAPVRHH